VVDALTDALNDPSGRLAETVVKRVGRKESGEISKDLLRRLDLLISTPGRFGKLARVRLAAEVAWLFERIPDWTRERIIPLFDWVSDDALDFWSARKYSGYIGSPSLFAQTKDWFLELFTRPDIGEEDLRVFIDWLVAIVIANRKKGAGYPLSGPEARSALRAAGERALPSAGHRLAREMEAAPPDDKMRHWDEIVGPVFEAVWPLDADLQSPRSTFKLVQILMATGDAFPRAADVVIPFIRPEDASGHTSVFSISKAHDEIYLSAPEKVLELLAAVIGTEPFARVYGLEKVLERVREASPSLVHTKRYQRLDSQTHNR
jgi:hypothetical protein